MGTQVDHLEVAPRMWDKTIAASYMPRHDNKDTPDQSPRAAQNHSASLAAKASEAAGPLSFLARFKAYVIPAIFIVCLLVVAYILWKYFTKYRNTKIVNGEGPAMNCPYKPSSDLQDPLTLIKSNDMSKYEIDSDEDDEDIKKRVIGSSRKPPTNLISLAEIDSESDEENEEDEDTESSGDLEEDDEPDLVKIEQLITTGDMSTLDDMPALEEDDTFSLRIPSHITEITEINSGNSKAKRPPRKMKPITL